MRNVAYNAAMSFFKEFKKFISQGNVADLAIAVVIGAAFGRLITSLVSDILVPPISVVLQGIDLKTYKWVISPAVSTKPEIALAYGNFIQVCIEFLVLAFLVFCLVKFLNRIRPKEEKAAQTENEQLKVLKDIREELRKK